MNKLTENSIKKAEIHDKQYKIYDGEGMFLLIHPNGSKYWRMKYTFDGKSKLASFGVWPSVSLKAARDRRHEAKQKIKMGINPIEEKRQNKRIKEKRLADKLNPVSMEAIVSSNESEKWLKFFYPHVKVRKIEASLKLLKSIIFNNEDMNTFQLLDKKELNEILGNIYRNRNKLIQIIWEIYLSFPILNITLLFLFLIILMDFFPALLTIGLYFILTVCLTVVLGLWLEKNVQE